MFHQTAPKKIFTRMHYMTVQSTLVLVSMHFHCYVRRPVRDRVLIFGHRHTSQESAPAESRTIRNGGPGGFSAICSSFPALETLSAFL